MIWKIAVTAPLIIMGANPIYAQDNRGGGENIVKTFKEFCVDNRLDVEAITQSVAKSGGWTEIPWPENYRWNKKADVKLAWTKEIDGRKFELLSGTANGKKVRSACVLRTEVKENFYPYFDEFKRVLKDVGLGGKSVDIPHYFRAGGKFPSGQRATAELITSWNSSKSRTKYTFMGIYF